MPLLVEPSGRSLANYAPVVGWLHRSVELGPGLGITISPLQTKSIAWYSIIAANNLLLVAYAQPIQMIDAQIAVTAATCGFIWIYCILMPANQSINAIDQWRR